MMCDILKDREKNYTNLLHLSCKYKQPILVGKINYPGHFKLNDMETKAYLYMRKLILSIFNGRIKTTFETFSYDGSCFFAPISGNPFKIKSDCINYIENLNTLGRIFDIDVFVDNHFISRTDLLLPKRKCIICDNIAHVCVRNQTHSIEECLNTVNIIINKYID
jgi:holo-ACP synthase